MYQIPWAVFFFVGMIVLAGFTYFQVKADPKRGAKKSALFAIIFGMNFLILVIPDPEIATIAVLAFGSLALIALLIFLWKVRSRDSSGHAPDEG